jgi:hypothetical protein
MPGEPVAPTERPVASAPSASVTPSAAPVPTEHDVEIGVGVPSAIPPVATAEPQPKLAGIPDPIHGYKPTILSKLDVGPTPLLLHGYSDCHLGSGAEVRCSGPVEVELLSRDQGPVTSASSPKDIQQREPTKVKLFRQSLCHDFYVRLRAANPVKCDVAVHAVVYPD